MYNKFDIIITTYNREHSLFTLVSQILLSPVLPQNIIVVDSSPIENKTIQTMDKVVYLRTSHGNQPYQRYLGVIKSQENILIFMDDDMRILDKNAFNTILTKYKDETIIGVQPNFINSNNFLQDNLPKSKIILNSNKFFHIIKFLTGYPLPDEGRISYCGIRGKKTLNTLNVECFNGGIFSIRKKFIFTKKFNFQLFNIFEKQLGMGEDTILGFEASQYGQILYLPNIMFLHDDQKNSTYSLDIFSYAQRVAYSRLYLSYEYVRLQKRSKLIAFIHYNWYMLWRIIGLVINILISKNNSKRKEILKGYLKGWSLALKDNKIMYQQLNKDYWNKEVLNDINKK